MQQSLSKRNIWKSVLIFLLLMTLLTNRFVLVHHHAYAAGVSPQAVNVYGQAGSFTTATSGTTASTLSSPRSLAFDSSGNAYIADYSNNRVLYYPSGSTTATRVYGQNGSFTTALVNNTSGTANTVSATSLYQPFDVTLDSSGDLYVADGTNSRVLYYAAGSTTATRVYGQGGSFTTATNNNGGISANSLNNANNFALDSSGNLYIADSANNRVLYYAAGSTTATRVYGQGGSFTTATVNNGGVSANSLSNPNALVLDSSGNLYVTDSANNRVLYYAAGSTTATRVYGQNGSFTTALLNNTSGTANTVSATSLSGPRGVTVDNSGNVYIADFGNNRMLYYPSGSTTATRVYGQNGSFTTALVNNTSGSANTVSATSLSSPLRTSIDSSGNLYSIDMSNNRVLQYQTALSVTTQPAASTAELAAISTSASVVDVGSGSVYTDFTGTVTAAIKAGTGGTGATLGGTTSLAAVSGVASFSNLTINVAGTGYILTLSYPGVGSINTNAFAITLTPAGFWKFDEGSGTTTADSSGNNNTGTITGASWVIGKVNTGLSFNGTSNYVAMGTAPAALQMGTSSFTVMSWFKTTATGGSQRLVSMGDASWASGYQLSIGPNGSTCTGCVGGSVGAGGTQANSLSFYTTGTFNDGLWHHSAMVINQTAHTAQLYVDGVAQAVSTQAGTCGTASGTSVNITACSSLSATGANAFTTGSSNGTGEYFTGSLDNVRVYASAVIGQDIQNLYTAASTGPQAITVYGQSGNFTTATSGTSSTTLNLPRGIAEDSNGNLYVSDYNNSRVLYYPAGSTTATRVYGQGGSFTSNTVNNGGITANSLNHPIGLALDNSGNLYIVDNLNNRVLYYPAGSTTATRVYGQGGSFTSNTVNNGGITVNSLDAPSGVTLDSSGNLYIADYINNRVLYYPAGSTTATRVYGQGGSFTSNTVNNGGITANSLYQPVSLAVDSSGNLYICDGWNNRVLYYTAGSTTATRVYGQGGSFITGTANNGGITVNSLSLPSSIALDSSGNLYITEYSNNRVLYYVAGSTTATRVYGQGGSFITGIANNSGISATSINIPYGITVDSGGNIYVVDSTNNRVLQFQTGLGMTAQPPASTPTLSPFSTSVALVDIGSNTVFTDFTGTIAVAIKAGTGTSGAALGGTTSLAATSGVATFSTLTINSSGTGYVLSFTSTGITLVDSYAFTIATPTLGGYWKFDEGSGTTTADSSGNANTGTITGASWINGKINTALSFNGTSNYVSMGTAPAALQMGTGSFTVTSWFKTTATGLSQRLVSMGDASWANGYQLSIGPNASGCTGCIGGSVGAGGTQANSLSFSTTSSFNDGTWHYAAMVIDQNANTAQIYVDGVAQAVTTQAGTCGTASGTSVNIIACNSLSATGANAFTTGSSNGTAEYFTGSLDSVRVYSGALGGADILSIYNSVPVGPQAFTIYGQGGNFTTSTANNGGVGTGSFNKTRSAIFDSSGNLYAIDYNNSRVLYFPVGTTTATRVYGQAGSFTTGVVNNPSGTPTADNLSKPTGLALDSSGDLYIADTVNSRVLYYPAGTTTATRVYGQGGSFTTGTTNNGGISATSLSGPNGIALDSSGNLYVADYGNNRVLYYPAGSTTATVVYGQGGSFTTGTLNNGGVSATSLYQPVGLNVDSGGNLYVSDTLNNRVLYYAAGSTTATRVYGQAGSFTTNTSNNGGISANSFNTPMGLTLSSNGNLYVVDENNNRVLYFPAGTTTATRVYGQAGSFTTGTSNNGGTSATSFNQPFGVSLDTSGNLFVADYSNSRVLQFQTVLSMTTQPAASTLVQSAISTSASLIDVGSSTVFTDFTGTVTAAIKSGTGTTGATLSGTTSVAAVSGVASFTTLKIDTSGTGYILTLSYPGAGSANTNSFTISLTLGGYWKFDEGSGTTTADSSGNGNTGTLTNSPTWSIGRINSALSFNGTNSYVTMGTAPAALQMGTGSFTVMSWFKTTATGGSQRLVSMGDASWANGYQLGVGPNASACTGCVGGSIGAAGTKANSLSFSSTSSFNDGNWHHAAMVVDQNANIVQLYVDGVAQAVSTQSGTCGTASGTSVNIAACNSLSATGANAFTTGSSNGTGEFFNGSLDDVSIYANALSSIDIQNIYASILISPQAIVVYGQAGSFTTGTANNGGVSATSLNGPRDAIFDSSGNLYVSDYNNNRVLYFLSGSTTATRVYGQAGSFTTNTANNGGISATSLNGPHGLALDSSGNLYVADNHNNRVLYYASGSTTATRVYGQAGSFTTNTANNGGISATSLQLPNDIALDSSGNLYIADDGNNRVLYYASGSTTATRVYGQAGSFTTNTANNGGVSANSLSAPGGVAVDSSGNLYIADSFNNRVLYYPSGSTTATRVYGQAGNFTTATGSTSATGIGGPGGVSVDSNNNLYVTDGGNSRILYFPGGSTIAARVYGQGGSFTTNTANKGGISATSLKPPYNANADSSGNIYVADPGNNRVLKFQTALSVTSQPVATTPQQPAVSAGATLIDVGSSGTFSDFAGTVTTVIKAGTGTAGATLSGTTSVAAVSGIANLSNLSINKAGAGYILTLSSPSVGSVNTNAFTINAATLAGYWPLDENTGTTTADLSGNADTGTLTGASWTPGRINSGLSFNGTSNYVSMGTPAALQMGTGSFTVLSWFKTSATTGSQELVSMGDASSASGYQLSVGPNGSACTGCVGGGIGAAGTQANALSFSSTSTFNDGKWHLAAMVIDQTAHTAQIYVDGVAQAVSTQAGTCGTASGTSVNITACSSLSATGATPFDLGSYNGASSFFNGKLDDVHVYNSALSSANIQNLYYATTSGPQAVTVYGQGGSFTTNGSDYGGGAAGLNTPRNSVLDSSGNLYVADYLNHRVLYYAAGSTTGTRVYGQGGIFTTGAANNGGISANSLDGPSDVALDSSGNLYVADALNNRVLYYAAGSTTATVVYGQAGSFTTNTANNGGISATSLSGPTGVALDSSNNLYVVDSGNNRVLYYAVGSTTATVVYGQGGSFTTNTANNGSISANSLSSPLGLALDTSNNLYIADSGNNRVLYYPSASTQATSVYGQNGSFLTGTANNGGISSISLSSPHGVTIDSIGNLYTADYGNNRVLYYPAGSTNAIRVYGQNGSFTTGTTNNGGISNVSLSNPYGVTADSSGNLYIADYSNNRILQFQTSLSVTSQPAASTMIRTSLSITTALTDIGSGEVFPDFTNAIAAAIKAGAGTTGAVLSGTTPITAVNGTASFTTLSIDTSGVGYILTFSSLGVGSGNTNTFTIGLPLAGLWPLDEDTGTIAYDYSTNGDNGTITGASWTAGKINSGLGFNGTSNTVSMGTPTPLKFGTGNFTVTSWFKTTSTAGNQEMVSMGDASSANGYQLSVGTNGIACTGCVGGGVGAGGTQANALSFSTTSAFNDGTWHQAMMVINQISGTAQMYVDGTAQAVTTQAGTCGTASGTVVNITACTSLSATGTSAFDLGSYNGASSFFTGSLDVPRLYSNALSAIDVQTIYTNDINTLSEYAANASFLATPGSTPTYTLPIAVTYQLTPAPGWSLSITSTTLTSGANTLSTTASKITSVANACTSTCTPTTMTNTISSFPMTIPAATTAPTAVKFFGTASGSGTGAYTVTPTIAVSVPYVAKTGAYTSIVTLTAATGP